MSLSQRVRQRRGYLGMSQKDLAQQLQMAQTIVSRIERGENTNPGAEVLKRLAIALRCSIDWLLEMYDETADHADPPYLILAASSP